MQAPTDATTDAATPGRITSASPDASPMRRTNAADAANSPVSCSRTSCRCGWAMRLIDNTRAVHE